MMFMIYILHSKHPFSIDETNLGACLFVFFLGSYCTKLLTGSILVVVPNLFRDVHTKMIYDLYTSQSPISIGTVQQTSPFNRRNQPWCLSFYLFPWLLYHSIWSTIPLPECRAYVHIMPTRCRSTNRHTYCVMMLPPADRRQQNNHVIRWIMIQAKQVRPWPWVCRRKASYRRINHWTRSRFAILRLSLSRLFCRTLITYLYMQGPTWQQNTASYTFLKKRSNKDSEDNS